ncbi:hypothetical protein ACIRL2_46100 [Embleya sp. NPDC127516]|uniref:hypothetical protein n=1 Tax=Embleya sp. NPDC127516 TaxID=3363990 RepID=UPI00382FE242
MPPQPDSFEHPTPHDPDDAAREPFHDTTPGLPGDAAETLLRLATTHRSIPDVARMIAILGDCSGMAAEDALRQAATTRPVSDLVLLADLLGNPTHARLGRRPAEEDDPHRPSGDAGAWPSVPSASTAQAPPERGPSTAAGTGTGSGAGLRWVTALGLAVSALALGSAIPASLRTPPYAAGGFALVGLVCLFLAGITTVRAVRGTHLATLVAGCATIATALAPRLVADAGAPFQAWGPIALGAGTLTALCAAAALTRPTDPPDPRQARRPVDFEPWEATMLEHRTTDTTRMLG